MEIKKNPKLDIERRRPAFFALGLVVALSITCIAFEWKQYDPQLADLGNLNLADEFEEEILITFRPETPPPPPPPPPAPEIIQIVDNKVDVPDIVIDTEFDPDLLVDIPEPVEPPTLEPDFPVLIAEHMPEFPGGERALFEFLGKNIKYPAMARDAGIKGRVYIEFVVGKDGSVSSAKILRGIGGGCDEEAERVVKMMPNWKPGRQAGKKVSVIYRLPVNFRLD